MSDHGEENKDHEVKHCIAEEKVPIDMGDEFDDNTVSSYAKFKTQNEIDLEQIEKYAPKFNELDELDDILDFGMISKYIDDGPNNSIVLVTPNNPLRIYDLDNIVCLKSKQVIGFVLDLVGPVNLPLYSVKLYSQYVEKVKAGGLEVKNQILDQRVYLAANQLKEITKPSLESMKERKGCDASNMHDEEMPEHEREFSDDEREREAKKSKKNKRKNHNKQGSDLEEGEIEECQYNSNSKNHKRPKKFDGAHIPVYSTNFSVGQHQPS